MWVWVRDAHGQYGGVIISDNTFLVNRLTQISNQCITSVTTKLADLHIAYNNSSYFNKRITSGPLYWTSAIYVWHPVLYAYPLCLQGLTGWTIGNGCLIADIHFGSYNGMLAYRNTCIITSVTTPLVLCDTHS